MHAVEPKVFLVAETQLTDGVRDYLEHIDMREWTTDAPSDAEAAIEVMSRLCYRSFDPSLNPNLTRVREGNEPHIANILKAKHGSVLEHSSCSFIFADVSRVFTHELVRHRAGTAMSQESLRFVRLDDLGFWAPTVIAESEDAMEVALDTLESLETIQIELAKLYQLDTAGVPFAHKKIVTSAMRRLAPMGLATTIGWTANFRTLRWVLDMRTHPSAEEEIRMVFAEVGDIVTHHYPNVFGDYTKVEVSGSPYPHFQAENQKV